MGADDSANPRGLTPRQAKWFASARASLESETGRTLEDWIVIARTCPETKPMARIAWMKAHHGLGMNRANIIMTAAFPTGSAWDAPEKLRASVWKDPAATAIFEAVEAAAKALDNVVTGQRKSFTGFSREFQFAAARPLKGGILVLGLAVDPASSPRLSGPLPKDGWSERLKSRIELSSAGEFDAELIGLMRQAWEGS